MLLAGGFPVGALKREEGRLLRSLGLESDFWIFTVSLSSHMSEGNLLTFLAWKIIIIIVMPSPIVSLRGRRVMRLKWCLSHSKCWVDTWAEYPGAGGGKRPLWLEHRGWDCWDAVGRTWPYRTPPSTALGPGPTLGSGSVIQRPRHASASPVYKQGNGDAKKLRTLPKIPQQISAWVNSQKKWVGGRIR